METKGLAAGPDPYDVLAREHRLIERVLDALGRICSQALGAGQLNIRAATLAIRFLRHAIPAAENGDPEAVRLFVRRARSFVSFLRDHIAKEDDRLADVVRSTLSPGARARLLREFGERERREIGERALERYSAMAEEIETLCGQTGPPGPSTGGAG